jgi:tetratricopeptide (TPR) repeat protein
MTKQIFTFIFSLTLLFNTTFGQNFKQQYNDLVEKKDTASQLRLLENWEKANNNDPELYVAYFNYYINKSMKEVIAIGDNPKGKDVLKLENTGSTKNEPEMYIYGDKYFDSNLLEKAFDYIETGIEKNPTRLDLWFGEIYMYGQLEEYENFTTQIIKTIDYSNVIKNKWTWTDNKAVEDPKKFMLTSIQDYQLQLYNTGDDSLLDNMKRIADAVLKYYPDHVESLTNLSIIYLIKKEYDKALDVLLKAEKLAPKDYIVLNNIAYAYKLKGDKKKAIRYYELTAKYGDEKAKEYAKEQIEELRKK